MDNKVIYDNLITKELSSYVEPELHRYIQRLVKKKSFSIKSIKTFINKATKLLIQLNESQKSFQGEHWSLRDWAAAQSVGYKAKYLEMTKLLIQGYYIMETARASIMNEEIDYNIGVVNIDTKQTLLDNTTSGQIHMSLDQFLYLFALGRSSDEFPALKAVGATGRISSLFSKLMKTSSAINPLKEDLFNDLLAFERGFTQFGLNYGQLYEAYCILDFQGISRLYEQGSQNILLANAEAAAKSACIQAKNSVPGYKGGDVDTTQIKAVVNGAGFSIMKLRTITAVLQDYVLIETLILTPAMASIRPILERYLFTPVKKDAIKAEIREALGEEVWKTAKKEINKVLKSFASTGGADSKLLTKGAHSQIKVVLFDDS